MWPQKMWGQRSCRVNNLCFKFFCKKGHCIHILWCIFMGLGHNDRWVESHIRPQQMWGQRSSRGQWPLVGNLQNWSLYPHTLMHSHGTWTQCGNTSMYVDIVINFANYHIHTHTTYMHTYTYYIHTYTHTTYRISDHIVSFWTTFRRDKNARNIQFSPVFWYKVCCTNPPRIPTTIPPGKVVGIYFAQWA